MSCPINRVIFFFQSPVLVNQNTPCISNGDTDISLVFRRHFSLMPLSYITFKVSFGKLTPAKVSFFWKTRQNFGLFDSQDSQNTLIGKSHD